MLEAVNGLRCVLWVLRANVLHAVLYAAPYAGSVFRGRGRRALFPRALERRTRRWSSVLCELYALDVCPLLEAEKDVRRVLQVR